MKKLLSILFSLLLAFTCLPTSTYAAVATFSSYSATTTTATKVSTLDTFDSAFSSSSSSTSSGTATGTSTQVGRIKVPENGTLIVQYQVRSDNRLTKATITGVSKVYSSTSDSVDTLVVPNVKKGTTYSLTATTTKNAYVQARFRGICIVNSSNRTMSSSSIIAAASTGNTMYQQFKVSKRGLANVAAFYFDLIDICSSDDPTEHSITYDLQKKNGSKWSTIRSGAKSTSKTNFVFTFGLKAGTYRIKYKIPNKAVLFAANQNKAITASAYGTSKKSAKEIARTKSKTQTLIAGESASKAQWYKIKVTSTKATTITLTDLVGDGNIYCEVYSPAGSTLTKKTGSNSLTFSGTVKKGTCYIKVYKKTAKESCSYKLTYAK